MDTTGNYDGPSPVIELEGTPFYVNGYLMALVQVDEPDNQIGLFDMLCLEDHYELWYDTQTKNVYDGLVTGLIPEQVKLFWFYPFDAMDPAGRIQGWMKPIPAGAKIFRRIYLSFGLAVKIFSWMKGVKLSGTPKTAGT